MARSNRPPFRKPRPVRLGHHAIDKDHAELADVWFQAVTCKAIQFQFFAARLRNLLRNHFAREASIIAEYGDELCTRHQQEHAGIIELCNSAVRLGPDNLQKAQGLLRGKFRALVREHIDSMDQILVMVINTRDVTGLHEPKNLTSRPQ